MDIKPIKFLYASDLRLDRPLALGEGASAYAPRARDAAYETTRRLVDCALSRDVDFVLLRGELCDACCGAKALLFLTEQTARLSYAGVPCYILNEGAPIDARWLAGFPAGVKCLNPKVDANTITCRTRSFPLASLLESALKGAKLTPLQALGPDENRPGGAWLVFLPDLPDSGEPEVEFIELDVLRWEGCEMDITHVETDEDLAASWKTVKDDFRGRGRPVLLHLRLCGVMKDRALFYGESPMCDPGVLMKKLNADEINRKNFVLVDSISDDALSPEPCSEKAANPKGAKARGRGANARGTNANGANALEAEFWEEINFFRSGIDLRVGLFETLKERGILKRLLATDAAQFLENMTEADMASLLKESCDVAIHGLFKVRAR